MNKRRLYFAYGSNINLEQMAFRCPNAKPLMPVTLSGYELAYRGYGGVATVIPKEGETVPGLLWSITPECEESLDQYEGYPKLYHKADVTVTDPETGKQYHTMMYEMDQRHKMPAVPSPYYYSIIEEGYRQNGMDTKPLLQSLHKAEQEWELLYGQNSFFEYPHSAYNRKKPHKNGRNER